MSQSNKASFRSQLYGGVCDIYDTEEMCWLRMSDDFQSKTKLASLLISQYRYNDALRAFYDALKIKEDVSLYIKIAGTNLTLLKFGEAKKAYDKAISLGVSEKALSYPLAIRLYLMGEYEKAAEAFQKCLPCDDELKIVVIYWELLSSLQSGVESVLKNEYSEKMNVGHHTAYEKAVRVILGKEDVDEAVSLLESIKSDLDYVVASYGIYKYLEHTGRKADAKKLEEKILERENMWPCISFLALLAEKGKEIVRAAL